MNLTDQGIVNELYGTLQEWFQQNGYAETLRNYHVCLKLLISSAKTVLEDSQPYLDDKLEKM